MGVLSVAKNVIEYCPSVIRALIGAYRMKTERSKFSQAIVNSGILSKIRLPKEELNRDNCNDAYATIHLWKSMLENCKAGDQSDILEAIFKAIPTNIESKS